jgi:hypothetical protein
MSSENFYDYRTLSGSRNFADLPETVSFEKLREISAKLNGAIETDFLTDWVTEVRLDFTYRGEKFSINNQMGDYWFFVDNPYCADEILLEVFEHFRKFLVKN